MTLEDPGTVRLVSAVVAWEIAVKFAFGRLELPHPPDVGVPRMVALGAMTPVPVDLEHALAVARLRNRRARRAHDNWEFRRCIVMRRAS